MKRLFFLLLILASSSSSWALTHQEESYIRNNCQDVLKLMNEGKSVEDKLTEALMKENKEEWDRLATCVSLIIKKKTEAVRRK